MMASSYRLRRVVVALSVVALTIPLLSGVAEAKAAPKTVIDSAPPAGTTSTTATFTFHSTISPATFTCKARQHRRGILRQPDELHGTHTGPPHLLGVRDSLGDQRP